MVTYDIPALARVTVGDDTPALVREGIAFQIGHFAVDATAPSPELPLIQIRSYAAFAAPTPVVFHQGQGISGRCWHHPEQRHATVRTATGFEVFTDTGEILVVLLLQIFALQKERSFLHAAGWVDGTGQATLVPGPGGVGKTALLTTAVQHHGARLLGDDLVLLEANGRASAFPRAFVLKPYHRTLFPDRMLEKEAAEAKVARWRPLMKFVRENAPFHGLLKSVAKRAGRLDDVSLWIQRRAIEPDFYTIPVAELFGAKKVADSGQVRRVVYLERHQESRVEVQPMSGEEIARRSLAVIHHEWVDYLRWYASMGAMEMVDWGAHFAQTLVVMQNAFQGAETAGMRVPVDLSPEDLATEFGRHFGFGDPAP